MGNIYSNQEQFKIDTLKDDTSHNDKDTLLRLCLYEIEI